MAAQAMTLNLDPDAPPSIDFMVPSKRQISMSGNWAKRLLDSELDIGCMRPFVGDNGRTYITRNYMGVDRKTGRQQMLQKAILTNDDANATLRFLDWIQLDNAVIMAAKPNLRAAADLRDNNLVYELPNGIAKTTIQYQQQSDISGAQVSMDGLRRGESDRPVFSLLTFPLPIIHKDFQYPLRQILASRTGYSPLDTTTAELAARRVSEQVEQFTLGCGPNLAYSAPGQLLGASSYAWNNANIYGYMNFPNRIAYSIVQPTSAGWTPQATVDDVLQMIYLSKAAFHRGPWRLYYGLAWDRYMNNDYKPTYNSTTLRNRLMEIDGIQAATAVDYIPDLSLILVQQTTDVVRLVIGMDITTVQWESQGGMEMNFKVMCVMLPQLRTDFYLNTGIIHGA